MNQMMNWKTACKLSLVLPLMLAGMGCAVAPAEGAQGEEATGSTSQAFSGGWSYTWNVASASSLDMGVDTNKTCFLAGVTGDLVSYAGFETYTQGSYVQINRRSGHYYLDISPSAGQREGATVFCVPTVANRTGVVTHYNWNANTAATLIAPATAGRQCFLTGVQNTSNFSDAHQAFTEASDSVQIFKTGGNWYIGGTGVSSGDATCVDVSGGAGGWEWIAPSSGTATHNLSSAGGGVTCALTGLGGSFQDSSWSDGVVISEEQSLLQMVMTESNGKTGWGTCFY